MSDEKSEKKRKLTNEPTPKLESTTRVTNIHRFFSSGKSANIRKGVIHYFRENQYKELKKELSDRGFLEKDQIKNFFLKEGRVILCWALMEAPNDEPLKFLTGQDSVVPKNTLKTVLQEENFAVFQTFLYGQVGLEEIKKSPPLPPLRELRVKKFQALLNIDNEAITNFIENNPRFHIRSIMEDFQTAKENIEGNGSASKVLID